MKGLDKLRKEEHLSEKGPVLETRSPDQGRGQDQGLDGLRGLALGFNSVDMSLCLLLYVGSCVFLMVLFFFFRVRSRRWKLRPSKLAV